MTYIIAEPCIDIKDRSCVDVCPVDCIHEFERILVIDPEECIDCFAPTEQLLTKYGVRTFAELENQRCRVLTDDGFKPLGRSSEESRSSSSSLPVFEERDRYGGWRLTTRNISFAGVWARHQWSQRREKTSLRGHFVMRDRGIETTPGVCTAVWDGLAADRRHIHSSSRRRVRLILRQ